MTLECSILSVIAAVIADLEIRSSSGSPATELELEPKYLQRLCRKTVTYAIFVFFARHI